jgi:hypothetical protein
MSPASRRGELVWDQRVAAAADHDGWDAEPPAPVKHG